MNEATQVCGRTIVIVEGRIVSENQTEELVAEHYAMAKVNFVIPHHVDVCFLVNLFMPKTGKLGSIAGKSQYL